MNMMVVSWLGLVKDGKRVGLGRVPTECHLGFIVWLFLGECLDYTPAILDHDMTFMKVYYQESTGTVGSHTVPARELKLGKHVQQQ